MAARLEQLLPRTLTTRTSLIDSTLTLADIADEASLETAVNNLQQLYRDSIGPMEEQTCTSSKTGHNESATYAAAVVGIQQQQPDPGPTDLKR